MINAKDIENLYKGIDLNSPVDLVEYFNNKLTELKMLVSNVSGKYETYTELAMVYYYITNLRAFVKARIIAIEDGEKNLLSCLYLAWLLKMLHNQLNLLISEFERKFNIS